MSELLLGWPNGSLGLLLAALAGVIYLIHAWRMTPWDVHDEMSYREPKKLSLNAVAPSLILFGLLVAMIAGIGALDRGIWPPLAIFGDLLGLALLPIITVRALGKTW
jgi:hypothetical protein